MGRALPILELLVQLFGDLLPGYHRLLEGVVEDEALVDGHRGCAAVADLGHQSAA